jgi:hypothetical protein
VTAFSLALLPLFLTLFSLSPFLLPWTRCRGELPLQLGGSLFSAILIFFRVNYPDNLPNVSQVTE